MPCELSHRNGKESVPPSNEDKTGGDETISTYLCRPPLSLPTNNSPVIQRGLIRHGPMR